MKSLSLVSLLLGLTFVPHSLQAAYIIDASCDPYRDVLTRALGSAFRLANIGARSMEVVASLNDPRGELTTLSNLLFRTENNDRSIVRQRLVNIGGLNGVTLAPGTAALPDDIIIQCGLDKWVKKIVNYKHTDYPEYTMSFVMYAACKTEVNFLQALQAITYNIDDQPTVITVCEPYLKQVQKDNLVSVEDTPRTKIPSGLQKLLGGKTEVELRTMFDATLLHELTHAKAAGKNPGPGLDLGGGTDDAGGITGSYGWKNCVQMDKSKASRNADSIACFTLGAYLLSIGKKINQDGSISDITPVVIPGS